MIRLLSGLLLAGAATAAIVLLPSLALRLVACGVTALAAQEYLRIAGGRGLVSLMAAVLACWWISGSPEDNALAVVLLAAVLAVTLVLAGGQPMTEAAAAAFAPLYVGVPLGLLAAVQARHGAGATLLLVGTVVISDSAQYYAGRLLGRRPLAPTISPKKTVEGALGGIIGGTAAMIMAGPRVLAGVPAIWLGLYGAGLVTLGICGDLFESRIKRLAGVKDSGSRIPGHGGVLDRIDALLFVTPAFYLLIEQVHA